MTDPPGLNPAQLERLAVLSEELGETQQAVGKILRHGYEGRHPERQGAPTNRVALERECGDVFAALALLIAAGDITIEALDKAKVAKLKKVAVYLHHNKVS